MRSEAHGSPSAKVGLGLRWARWTTRRRWAILAAAAVVGPSAAPIAARLPLSRRPVVPAATGRRHRCATCTRSSRGPRCSGRSSSRSNRTTPAGGWPRRGWCAIACGRCPPSMLLGVDYDSGARDRFAWAHRYLLAPTDELTGVRDELAAAKGASQSALRVARRRRGQAADAPPIGDRLRALKQQLDAAQGGRRAPDAAPLEGRPPPAGRGADALRRPTRSRATSRPFEAVERAADEARRLGGPAPSGSGSPATSPTPRRSIRRCWAGWCARPSSRS